MGQFGEALRKERESRGIELETISGSTKVVTRYLTALEDEHFEILPGGILSKGIVRSYAQTLGLDQGEWVERFLEASQRPAETDSDADWAEFAKNVGVSRENPVRASRLRLRWAGVALLLLVLVGLGWFVYRYVSGRELTAEAHERTVTSASVMPPAGNGGQ
ncbi:MAG: helix-turn-helix transcriptional regulator [Acidobacteriaceae bacterium]